MPTFTTADIDRVRAAAISLIDEYHLPGMSVGVVSGSDLIYAEGFGYADIENARPQDPQLRQRIGSITKTMVGLCAMSLVEEGKLSLDDRLIDRASRHQFHRTCRHRAHQAPHDPHQRHR